MTSPTPRRAKHDTPRPHNRGGGHLTTPPTASAPLRRGELFSATVRSRFPSMEGWHDTGPRENAIFVGVWAGVVCYPSPISWATYPRDENTPMPTASPWGRGVSRPARRGGGVVRDCGISHLLPFVIASGAWRSSE